jgi:hypothetical protein
VLRTKSGPVKFRVVPLDPRHPLSIASVRAAGAGLIRPCLRILAAFMVAPSLSAVCLEVSLMSLIV